MRIGIHLHHLCLMVMTYSTIGMTVDDELQSIYDVTEFMRGIFEGFKNYPDDAFYKALVFLHKFYRKFSFRDTKYDKYIIGTTCLFIAAKLEDRPVKLSDISLLYYRIDLSRKKLPVKAITEEQRSQIQIRICELESEILRQTGYDLEIDLPYNYIRKYKDYPAYGAMDVVKLAEWFCNDTFLRPLCLAYHPLQIACGCIYFAMLSLDIILIDYNGSPWYKFLNSKIELMHVELFSKEIMEIFKKKIFQRQQLDAHLIKVLPTKRITTEKVNLPIGN